ncbi:MAG: hypothetical protein ABIF71_13250 [Planctomycetota bacterium]
MSVKPLIYLDTTIPSAYYDRRAEERRLNTIEFWEDKLNRYRTHISALTINELSQTVDLRLKKDLLALVAGMDQIKVVEPMHTLAGIYVQKGIFPARYYIDALHAAVATCAGMAHLVSWNFEHLVQVKTRHLVSAVNAANGYKPLEIVSPLEL